MTHINQFRLSRDDDGNDVLLKNSFSLLKIMVQIYGLFLKQAPFLIIFFDKLSLNPEQSAHH